MTTEFRWRNATEELPKEGRHPLLVVDVDDNIFTAASYRDGWFRLVCAGYPYLSDKHIRFWAKIPPYKTEEERP